MEHTREWLEVVVSACKQINLKRAIIRGVESRTEDNGRRKKERERRWKRAHSSDQTQRTGDAIWTICLPPITTANYNCPLASRLFYSRSFSYSTVSSACVLAFFSILPFAPLCTTILKPHLKEERDTVNEGSAERG